MTEPKAPVVAKRVKTDLRAKPPAVESTDQLIDVLRANPSRRLYVREMSAAMRAKRIEMNHQQYRWDHPNTVTVIGPLYPARTKGRTKRGWTELPAKK